MKLLIIPNTNLLQIELADNYKKYFFQNIKIMSNLKIFRQYLKLSQSKLAKKLEITQGAYNNYENANRKIPTPVLEKLSNIGLNIDWLITNVGPMLKSELTKKANDIDLDNLTPRQKAEVVIGDLAKQMPQLKMNQDPLIKERLIRLATVMSRDHNLDIAQLYSYCKTWVEEVYGEDLRDSPPTI